jgi:hypothetical protein
MGVTKSTFKFLGGIPKMVIMLPLVAGFLLIAVGIYRGGTAVQELLWENVKLKKAITNLTDAGKIGYAKVISQVKDERGAVVSTTLKFVETDRDDELKKVLEKEYTIAGDVIHFDALIVKFGDKMVMDGKKKGLYLWRRVYGEKMAPADGFAIEEPGAEPRRYETLLTELSINKRQQFWEAIWDLANDPAKLRDYDIEAIYGNVTYTRLKAGLVYIFRISATGQVYPEVVPEI